MHYLFLAEFCLISHVCVCLGSQCLILRILNLLVNCALDLKWRVYDVVSVKIMVLHYILISQSLLI